VQSLLQRTDSMLSRSSDRSTTRQRSATTSEHNIQAPALGHAQAPSPLETREGFGFLEDHPDHDAAETPTLRGNGGAAAALGLRSPSIRRRAVAFEDAGGGGGGSSSRFGGTPFGQSLASSAAVPSGGGRGALQLSSSFQRRRLSQTSDTPSMHSPGSDVQGVGGLGGLARYAPTSRSPSQAALNEMADR
jgi:hypothetical protein